MYLYYRNDLKFSDRKTWANSVDQDLTAPGGLISVYTVFAILSASNLRIITVMFWGIRIFRSFTVVLSHAVFWSPK